MSRQSSRRRMDSYWRDEIMPGSNGPLSMFGDFGFVGGQDVAPNYLQNNQICINYYAEMDQQNPKEVVGLLGCPGLTQLIAADGIGAPGFDSSKTEWPRPSNITNLPVRGLWVLPNEVSSLAVIGDTCYLVHASGASSSQFPMLSLVSVGTLATSSGPVCIRDNNAGGFACI